MIDMARYLSVVFTPDPGDLVNKNIKRSHTNGVLVHTGFREAGDSVLLEYLFPKQNWTEAKAREWVKTYNPKWRDSIMETKTDMIFKERWDGAPFQGKVDRDNFIIRDVVLLNSKAQAGRRYYPMEVMKESQALFEERPVYFNHPKDGEEHIVRDVKEKIGVLEHVHTIENSDGTGTLKADLQVMAGPTGTWMMDIAEKTPRMAGFSINAHGGMQKDDSGKELVERIDGVHSVDLVSEASATVSIFESLKTAKKVKEDDDMELKEQIEKLESTLKEQVDKLATLTTERDTLAKEKTELEEKLKTEEHDAMIAAVLIEAKLPDTIDETLMAALKRCETAEDAKKFAEALKKTAGESDPNQEEGNHPLNEGDKKKKSEGFSADTLAESMKG